MSLIACGSIYEGHEWLSDDSRGRQEIFMCFADLLCEHEGHEWLSDDSRGRQECFADLLCEQFCRFVNEGAKISIKSYFMRSFFILSVFSSSEVFHSE